MEASSVADADCQVLSAVKKERQEEKKI